MAEGKKSFVLYCDIRNTVAKLPTEKQAELFMLILDYVNDMNPETEDLLLQIAFEPIKLQLKRDLKKWDSLREKRSEAGKLGGLKSGEARSANAKQNEANEASASKLKQNEANEAVTVTATANVTATETETEILLKKEPKEKSFIEKINLNPFQESFRPEWEKWIEYKKTQWKQTYKRIETQQTAFKHLLELSKGNPDDAKKIIDQSIGNLWKGLIELKSQQNGKENFGHNRNGNQQTGTGRVATDFSEPL